MIHPIQLLTRHLWAAVWPPIPAADDNDRWLLNLRGHGVADNDPIRGASDGLHRPEGDD